MLDRDAAIAVQREAARRGRKKKKRTASSTSLASNTFQVLQILVLTMILSRSTEVKISVMSTLNFLTTKL